jgi:hypothetical protein
MEITGGYYYSNVEQLKQEEIKLKEVKDIASTNNEQTKPAEAK